ncbi:hypothetical protein NMY22_g4132 [Coprinellus aureogranulatus]|nr:hypothetical protein NMY22_g4132 [Coprinellus aureogranulatus]
MTPRTLFPDLPAKVEQDVSGLIEVDAPAIAATIAVRLSRGEVNRDGEHATFDKGINPENQRRLSSDYDDRSISATATQDRLHYLATAPKYELISTQARDWDDFLTAFVTTFCCHAMLWSIDICHRDIRPHNLMWDPVAREAKLCDFDWCHLTEPLQLGSEAKAVESKCYVNAGALIFMSSDLLTSNAMAGKMRRVYRYDVEAFLYVFVWLIFRNMGGFLPGWASPIRWNDSDRHLIESERYHHWG